MQILETFFSPKVKVLFYIAPSAIFSLFFFFLNISFPKIKSNFKECWSSDLVVLGQCYVLAKCTVYVVDNEIITLKAHVFTSASLMKSVLSNCSI